MCSHSGKGSLVYLFGKMSLMRVSIPPERIRDVGDRSWTQILLELVSAPDTEDSERDKAFRTLTFLEDYRSVDLLAKLVEDSSQPTRIRTAASRVICGMGMVETTDVQRRAWWASGDPVLMAHSRALMTRSPRLPIYVCNYQ